MKRQRPVPLLVAMLSLLLVLVSGCGSASNVASGNTGRTATPAAPPSVDLQDLHVAFDDLLNQSVEKPTPQLLLNAAWSGLITEAGKEGLNTSAATKPSFTGNGSVDFQALQNGFQQVLARSKGQPNSQNLNYAAIDAMAQAVGDSHTTFLPPISFQQFNRRDAGDLGTSVGFRIQRSTNPPPLVLEVVAGSAAEAAGMHAGDTLLSVNGRPIQSYSLRELSRTLEGPDGTRLPLGIRRAGSARQQELTLVRRTISLDIVSSRVLPGNIGYLRIREFPARTFVVQQVDQALGDFDYAQASGIILDLRGNPGGAVPILQQVASRFVSQTPLAIEVGRTGQTAPMPRQGPFDLKQRLAVLVDDGSASSAELLTAAVQNYNDGLIVGARTCGCLMEAIEVPLPDQRAGLEIAVARVLTPVTHVSIEGNPITPDDLVTQDPRLLEQGRDPQLEAALQSLGVSTGVAATVTYAVSQGTAQ